MSNNLPIFREYINDPEEYEREINNIGGELKDPYNLPWGVCLHHLKIHYYCEVDYKFHIKCNKCGETVDLKNLDEYDSCYGCYEKTYEWIEISKDETSNVKALINLEEELQNLKFEEDHDSYIQDDRWVEYLTFTKHNGEYTFYGVTSLFLSDEPNSWSSSPHDDYVVKIWLFDDINKRNEFYDEKTKGLKILSRAKKQS